jgi:3-dehydroquinate dehydratase-1
MQLGSLQLGAHPRIVATITGETSLSVLARLPREGADIIEVRLDHFPSLDAATLRLKLAETRHVGLPLIATVRSVGEGGARALSDSQRLAVYETALEFVEAVDIELGSETLRSEIVQRAHAAKKLAILSYHNFQNTPTGGALDVAVDAMREAGADICKLATLVQSSADVLRLFALLERQAQKKDCVVIGLGKLGKITRVAFPLFGSLLTYGFVDKPLADGQLHFAQLRDQLKLYLV